MLHSKHTIVDRLINGVRFTRTAPNALNGNKETFTIDGLEVPFQKWQNRWLVEEQNSARQPSTMDTDGALESTIKLNTDWLTDSNLYNLGTQKGAGNTSFISIGVIKFPDRTIQFAIEGPFRKSFTFRVPIPEGGSKRELPFEIKWKNDEVHLYLRGQLIETQQA